MKQYFDEGFEIMKQYFDNKSKAGKCQLFLALLKSRNMAAVRRKLGIITLKNIESSNHIVKSLVVALTSIGKKTCSQDCNVAHIVLVNQSYVDPQDNVIYLNTHHKLWLYIQINLKNIQ